MKKPVKKSHSSILLNYLIKMLGYILTFAAGLATMLGILSYFNPNISVTPLIMIDSSRPLSIQFVVTNNSFLTMYDIKYALAVDKIEGRITYKSYGGPPGVNKSSPRITAPQYELMKPLGPNYSDTISCDFDFLKHAEPISSADIGLIISFRIAFTPWRQERIYHFITQKDSNGKLYWFPKPPD